MISNKPNAEEQTRTTESGEASHVYAVLPRDFMGPLASLVLAVALFAVMAPLERSGWIRPDIHLRNPDQAGFNWKRNAAKEPGDATVLISGDSSCTTGIDPLLVSADPQGERLLNLGLVIDLPLSIYADALQTAADASRGSARVAVLLVSPQRLAHPLSGDYFASLWTGGVETASEGQGFDRLVSDARSLWRASFPFRLFEPPLRGDGRLLYGFASCITAYVDRHRGTFQDPGAYRRGPRREDPAALSPLPDLAEQGRSFRRVWRGRIPLFVAIAPIPESYAPMGYLEGRQQVLADFAAAVGADGTLQDLPAVMADVFFASPTHLNVHGQAVFTRRFVEVLRVSIQRTDSTPDGDSLRSVLP